MRYDVTHNLQAFYNEVSAVCAHWRWHQYACTHSVQRVCVAYKSVCAQGAAARRDAVLAHRGPLFLVQPHGTLPVFIHEERNIKNELYYK